MDPIAEKEARIDNGETFAALRKAGKISLALPTLGEGIRPLDGKYPYISRRLGGTRGAKYAKEVKVTRRGYTMTGHLVESAAHEREIMSKAGMYRE